MGHDLRPSFISYMLFLVNRPWSLFSLGHSNLYYLISCDIPSLDLVIHSKCLFFSFDVKSRKITPLAVCKPKCRQWQGMAYEMCTSSMACLEPMKLVWTTPIFLEFSMYITYFSYIIMILLNSLQLILPLWLFDNVCITSFKF